MLLPIASSALSGSYSGMTGLPVEWLFTHVLKIQKVGKINTGKGPGK
jgi:hypothetical protein